MNRAIVRKNLWQETTVPPDAALEIVEFVGGGSDASKAFLEDARRA